MIFQPADPSSGLWVARACPGSSGSRLGPSPAQAAWPFHGPGACCPPPCPCPSHSDRGTLDTPVDLKCASQGRGRKPESPEKTHADEGEGTISTQTVSATRPQCFPLITFTRRRWKKWQYLRTSCTRNKSVRPRMTHQWCQQVFLTFSVITHVDGGQF